MPSSICSETKEPGEDGPRPTDSPRLPPVAESEGSKATPQTNTASRRTGDGGSSLSSTVKGDAVCALVSVVVVVLICTGIYYAFFYGETNKIDVGELEDPPLLPEKVLEQLKETVRQDSRTMTYENKRVDLSYYNMFPLDAIEKAVFVILLHGKGYDSTTWFNLNTLIHLANWGYHTLALDLPDVNNTGEFIQAFIKFAKEEEKTLRIEKVVIVSPTTSGSFSLPFLFKKPDKSTQKTVGFIPIALVGTENYIKSFTESKIPTLIMYGERDTGLGYKALQNLKNFPNHQIAEIPGAGQACYIDQPDLFHKVLYYWLNKVVKR